MAITDSILTMPRPTLTSQERQEMETRLIDWRSHIERRQIEVFQLVEGRAKQQLREFYRGKMEAINEVLAIARGAGEQKP